MVDSMQITSSLQDYLEVILSLSKQQRTVRVTDIANSLDIAKASVSQALNSLKKQGLIKQSYYGPVELTAKGKEYAEKIRYRHEVLRFFLMEVLGVSPEIAEKDACLLEHDLSNETFESLLEFLEKDKITTRFKREVFKSDEILMEKISEETQKDVSLVEMKPGKTGKISSIGGGQSLEKKLEQLGIRKGKEVTKISSMFSHGPVTIKVGGFQVAIGYGKATRILVEVNDDEDETSRTDR